MFARSSSPCCSPVRRPRSARGPLACAFLAALSPLAAAQLQFEELGKRHLPSDDDSTAAVVRCDVDGDGDLDLVVVNRGSIGRRQDRLYVNDGDGVFVDETAARLPPDDDATEGVAAGDVDGDGDPDLVLANSDTLGGQNRLYLNDGAGVFSDATPGSMPVRPDLSLSVALGDVDGDGDLDAVFGNGYDQPFYSRSPRNRLYLNDGAGTFTDATAGRLPFDDQYSFAVALGDVEGDGDLDLVVGNAEEDTLFSGQNRLYLNDGTGTFADVTAVRLPVDRDGTRSILAGDVDADGDLDLVTGNRDRFFGPEKNRLYVNDGAGKFTDVTNTQLPIDPPPDRTSALALGDVDADGDPDLVIGNAGLVGQDRLYLNDGSGIYVNGTLRLPRANDDTYGVALGDVDGDGDLDVVFGNDGQDRICFNDGSGNFKDGAGNRLPPDDDISRALALGDVDADGDTDLVFGNVNAQTLLYLNDGTGSFADGTPGRLPTALLFTQAAALSDVDADGDPDLVLGNLGSDRLYVNDGSGSFADVTAVGLPPDTDATGAVALGDVDGDGDPDLVLGNEGQQNRLLLNGGGGVFADATAARLPPDTDWTQALALGDVDGDGDLDLVLGNGLPSIGQQSRLYVNDGTGTFADETLARLPPDEGITQEVVLEDVDGDGDQDLLLATGENLRPQQNRLYLNDGRGTFADVTDTHLPPVQDVTYSAALADVDGDGDTDLAFGNSGPDRLCLNDGSGMFSEAARLPVQNDVTESLALADVDGDGDPDLVLGNAFGQNRLYLNLLRQLDSPFLVFPGRAYRLDVYSRLGSPPASFALPYLSPAAATLPLPPYGTLRLDPAQLTALPILAVPQPAGEASTSIVFPSQPSLVGATVHAQALLVAFPLGLSRLTNLTADVVRR